MSDILEHEQITEGKYPTKYLLYPRAGAEWLIVIFSAFASSPPAIADDTLAAATIVWNYVGELIFNMLVLVGAIKMSDRIIRELMGLG